MNATTALPLVSEASSVPVFGVSDTLVGHGIVGGYVVSFADQGKIAAEIAAQIVQGKAPAEIPIVKCAQRVHVRLDAVETMEAQ